MYGIQDPAQPSGAQEDVVDVDTAPQGGAAATWAVQKVGALHPSFTVCQDTIRQREMDRRSALVRLFISVPIYNLHLKADISCDYVLACNSLVRLP